MRHKYVFGALLCFFSICLYIFQIIYAEAKEKAISDWNSRQMIHARQAKLGIEDFFYHTLQFLNRISASGHIVNIDEEGKIDIDFARTINVEAIKAMTRVDASGRILYTSPFDESLVGRDISGQLHIQKILKTRRPVVSEVFQAVQGYSAVAVHTPVFRENEFCGTIGVLVDVMWVSRTFLQEIRTASNNGCGLITI